MKLTEELKTQLIDWANYSRNLTLSLWGVGIRPERPKYIIIDGKPCMPKNILSDPISKKIIVDYLSFKDFDNFSLEYDGEFLFMRY